MRRGRSSVAAAPGPTIAGAASRTPLFASSRELSWSIKLLIGTQGVALPVYAALLLWPVPGSESARYLIAGVVLALPGVLCLTRAGGLRSATNCRDGCEPVRAVADRTSDRRLTTMRRGYALLGAGCMLYAIGCLLYVVWIAQLHPAPMPNWADIGYLGCYPLLAGGMLVLAFGQQPAR